MELCWLLWLFWPKNHRDIFTLLILVQFSMLFVEHYFAICMMYRLSELLKFWQKKVFTNPIVMHRETSFLMDFHLVWNSSYLLCGIISLRPLNNILSNPAHQQTAWKISSPVDHQVLWNILFVSLLLIHFVHVSCSIVSYLITINWKQG